ncbi:MAG: VWA domain-containing protein [Geminicoccaceae bacterium]
MIFDTPWFALLIVVIPICLGFYLLARRRRRAALDQLIGHGMPAETIASDGSGALGGLPRPWILAAVILCLVAALMQPNWGRRAEDMPRSGRDIVVLLDTSLSMLAEDVQPNRLERAKAMVRNLADAIKDHGGHRLALIAFAGRPSLQSPLTLDYDLFLQRLDETDIETVAYEGSLIGDAIHHALERLGGMKPGFADLILVTDGEDHGGLPIDGAAAAAAADIDLYTIGIGDSETGAPIPVLDEDGARSLLEYDGFEIRSKVQADLLAEMAQLTKGRFLGAKVETESLERLYRDVIAAKPRRQITSEETDVSAHRYQWFVLAALILLGFDWFWRHRPNGTT